MSTHYSSPTSHSNNTSHPQRKGVRPVAVALAVAGFGLLAMLLVDHGPWNRPRVQAADVVNNHTIDQAARAVGATVTPTAPEAPIEPAAPGPKPAQPANPKTP